MKATILQLLSLLSLAPMVDGALEDLYTFSDPVFFASGLDYALEFQISDYVSDEMFAFSVWDGECANALDMFTEGSTPLAGGGDGSGSQNLNITLSTTADDIANAPDTIYSEKLQDGTTIGNLTFCVRAILMTPPPASIQIDETDTIVTVTYDLSSGFEVVLDTDFKKKDDFDARDEYGPDAYWCDPVTGEKLTDEDLFVRRFGAPGVALSVCVVPDERAIRDGLFVDQIDKFSWIREDDNGGIVEQPAILDGQSVNSLTMLECDMDGCDFQTILKSDFFSRELAPPTAAPTDAPPPGETMGGGGGGMGDGGMGGGGMIDDMVTNIEYLSSLRFCVQTADLEAAGTVDDLTFEVYNKMWTGGESWDYQLMNDFLDPYEAVPFGLVGSVESNLALETGALASQSTAAHLGGVPSRAIDGNTDGTWAGNSVSHTAYPATEPAWWRVDLGTNSRVSSVVVWGRTESSFVTRMNFGFVELLNSDDWVLFSEEILGMSQTNPTLTINLPNGGLDNVAAIRVRHETNSVELAEVQVFGVHTPLSDLSIARHSPGKIGSQPSFAINGDTNGGAGAKLAQTERGRAWWRVDLDYFMVTSINIYGRTDANCNTLNGGFVEVLDDQDIVLYSEEINGIDCTGPLTITPPGLNSWNCKAVRIRHETNAIELAEVQVFGVKRADNDGPGSRCWSVDPVSQTIERNMVDLKFVLKTNGDDAALIDTAAVDLEFFSAEDGTTSSDRQTWGAADRYCLSTAALTEGESPWGTTGLPCTAGLSFLRGGQIEREAGARRMEEAGKVDITNAVKTNRVQALFDKEVESFVEKYGEGRRREQATKIIGGYGVATLAFPPVIEEDENGNQRMLRAASQRKLVFTTGRNRRRLQTSPLPEMAVGIQEFYDDEFMNRGIEGSNEEESSAALTWVIILLCLTMVGFIILFVLWRRGEFDVEEEEPITRTQGTGPLLKRKPSSKRNLV